MANPHRGEVAFDAGGITYTLSYSVNALCELESELGDGVTQVAEMMSDPDKMRMTSARAVFCVGLHDHHPDVTREEAGTLMTEIGLVKAIGLIAEAFALAFPEPTGPLGKRRSASAGTGRRSTGPASSSALLPTNSGV